ncbi:MAG: zinc-ribbon domain-containing protein [Bacteroidia bacterium]
MFVIFGWNHKASNNYGPVEQRTCPNCKNTSVWDLTKISFNFSLFFIPLFSHTKEYALVCPICQHGSTISANEFEEYLPIAELNVSYDKEEISEEDKQIQLNSIQTERKKTLENEKLKTLEEIRNWVKHVANKTDAELNEIVNDKRDEYNPALIIAAELELDKRKLIDEK